MYHFVRSRLLDAGRPTTVEKLVERAQELESELNNRKVLNTLAVVITDGRKLAIKPSCPIPNRSVFESFLAKLYDGSDLEKLYKDVVLE
jgi:hypothetical protein